MKSISKYLPLFLFASFAGRVIFNGDISFSQATALAVLGVVAFANQYYDNNKRVDELEEILETERVLNAQRYDLLDKRITDTTQSLNSVKIGAGISTRRASNG